MLALGTAAPLASWTTPVTLPLNWAKETPAVVANTIKIKKQRKASLNVI
jgi:hypothetical protein